MLPSKNGIDKTNSITRRLSSHIKRIKERSVILLICPSKVNIQDIHVSLCKHVKSDSTIVIVFFSDIFSNKGKY